MKREDGMVIKVKPDDELLLPVTQDYLRYGRHGEHLGESRPYDLDSINLEDIRSTSPVHRSQLERQRCVENTSFSSLRMKHDRVMEPVMPSK